MISLMVGASLPIHPSSRQKQMRLEALAMRDGASAELAALKAESRGRLGELYAEFGRATALITLYRQSVIPLAEANASSALAAYREGSSDFADLLDAQMAINRYQSSLIQWQVDQGKALAELEMLIAAPLLDPNSSVPRPGRPQ
jgi:cobalt-zinc-cadmium efflux system outer membrane protein